MQELAKASLTASEVADYLRDHPDFLLDHPDLLTGLQLAHDAGGAVSLIEKQVGVLRTERQELLHKLQAMQDEAAANEVLLGGINQLIRDLVALNSGAQLMGQLQESLKEVFGLEQVCLYLEHDPGKCSDWPATQLLADSEGAAIASEIYNLNAYVGRAPVSLRQKLRLKESDSIGSIALLKLPMQQPAFLMLGHSDERRFESSMATDFVEHLVAVMAALLERHL